MEFRHWSRLGESARIFAFLPNAWLDGGVENPSIKLFNTIVFVSSLLLLFLGLWMNRKAATGLILLVSINATPFFLYEVYVNQNIFALMGSLFLMIIGINSFILFNRKASTHYLYVAAIVSTLLIGFSSEIRNEVSIVIVSLMLIYLFASTIQWRHKIWLPME
jgi:thiol:disulfide interchange protein